MTRFDMPLSLTACLVLFNIVICSTERKFYVEMDEAPNPPTRGPTMEPTYPGTLFSKSPTTRTSTPKRTTAPLGVVHSHSCAVEAKAEEFLVTESTSVQTIVPAPANRAPPASLVLPLFRMDDVTMRECLSLDSENCHVSINSANCTNKNFYLYCNNLASNSEMRLVLEKMERMNRDRPISIGMSGQRSLTQELLAPVARNILWLDILSYENLTSGMLKNLDLPNLIQLYIFNCTNMRIHNGDLASFPQLRILGFNDTLIVEMEKGSFDALPGLKMLVLKFGLLLQSQRSTSREQLWHFHCSCEYVWLRDLFRRRPLLLKARRSGEIYNVGGLQNKALTKKDIFVPVDCAKDGLIGSAEQEPFSINDDC